MLVKKKQNKTKQKNKNKKTKNKQKKMSNMIIISNMEAPWFKNLHTSSLVYICPNNR